MSMWFIDTDRLPLCGDDAIVTRALRVCESRGITGVAPLPDLLAAIKSRHGVYDALWIAWRVAPRPVVDKAMAALLRRLVRRRADALGVVACVAALYERRISGDPPSPQEWSDVRERFGVAPPSSSAEKDAFAAARLALGDAHSCDQRRLVGMAWQAGQAAAKSAAGSEAAEAWWRNGTVHHGLRCEAVFDEQADQLRDLLAALEA